MITQKVKLMLNIYVIFFIYFFFKGTLNVRTRVYTGISSSYNLDDFIAWTNSHSPSESGYGEDFVVAGDPRDNYGVCLAAMFVAPVTG